MRKKIEYCLEMIESERGWGQNRWANRYKSAKARQAEIDDIKKTNTLASAPDYYITYGAQWIEIDGKR